MKPNSLTLATGLSILALVLGGCASDVKLDTPVPVETRGTAGTGGGAAGGTAGAGGAAGSAGQSGVASVDLNKSGGGSGMSANLPRIVYFDYDSYVVKDEFRNVVDANANMLAANRTQRMSLEGHTDERGGREYNLALGQKRAEAVARAMTLLGASESQIEAVSFGKERPAAVGHDEAAWAMNRRVELNGK